MITSWIPKQPTTRDQNLIKDLRTTEKRSTDQDNILALADKATRTRAEDRALHALLRAEHLAIAQRKKLESARSALRKVRGSEEKSKKRERDKKLFHAGMLVEAAGLIDRTDAELIGALAALVTSATTNPGNWDVWARKGQPIADAREAQRAARAEERKLSAEERKRIREEEKATRAATRAAAKAAYRAVIEEAKAKAKARD